MDTSPLLFPVLDLAGVEGAFVLDRNSRVLAFNTKSLFTHDLVQNAAVRVATLFSALGDYLRPAQEVALSFEHFQLIVRQRDGLLIAVIVQGPVNQVALKLACNVAVKKLQEAATAPIRPNPTPGLSRPAAPPMRPAPATPPVPPARRPPPPKSSGIWG